MSAIVPDEQEKLAEVSSEVSAVVARARAIEVDTPQHAQDATAFLAEIKAARDRSERARRFLVDPLNAHVKAINERIKSGIAPLIEADQLLRGKVIAFHREQERLRAEEQARLDEERRVEEARAAEARRVAWEEAQRAEREAEEAAAKRAAQRGKRRKEIAALSDAELIAVSITSADYQLATEELAARKQAREAQERAAEAMRVAEEATQASIAARAAPPARASAPAPLAADSGSASVHHTWKATIVDPSRVPRRYLVPDVKAINAAVKAGERDIPGVLIEQVAGLAVRAHG